jgi:hypothetical protein
MNAKLKSYKQEQDAEDTPRVKTFDLLLTVTDQDLDQEVMQAFNLAKSSGQELNLTFHPEPMLTE